MIPVVIVGLGRIGAGNVGLAGELPLSHLAAARATPGLAVAGLVDPDPQARAAARRVYPTIDGKRLVGDVSDLPEGTGEVIAICTPTAIHATTLARALARRPRLIIVEKPLAASLAEARRMAVSAEAAGVALRVNFQRRFDPRLARWRARAPASPRAIVMRYGNGLMNYGSHMIDLLLDWYGPVETVQALGALESRSADPSPSFRCRMAAGFDAVAIGFDGLDYDQLEIDVFGLKERLELRAGGAEIRRHIPVEGLYYKSYRHLAEIEAERDRGLVGGFVELYAAITAHLKEGAPLGGCDGGMALAGMAVLDAVQRSAAAVGAAVKPEPTLSRAA